MLVLVSPSGWDFERRQVAHVSQRPVEEGRRSATLWVAGRRVGEGIWLSSGDRLHLALRDPLGQPRGVLRVAHGVASFEWVGEVEVVSLDATPVLSEWGVRGPSGLVDLVAGRLPTVPDVLERTSDGWRARLGGLVAGLEPSGRLVQACSDDGRFGVRIEGSRRTLTLDGFELVVDLGPLERAPVPERAFAIGTSGRTVSLHRLARGFQQRWFGGRVSGR